MSEDIDDKKFRLAVEDRRHNELVSLLKQFVAAVKIDNGKDSELVNLIQKSNGNIDVFLAKLKEVANPKIEAPNITLNNDNSEVIKAVNDSSNKIYECLERVENLLKQLVDVRMADIEAIPVRGGYQGTGQINKVTFKTVLQKSKYQA